MVSYKNNRTTWLRKTFDLKHGYGWHCQIYNENHEVTYGFSKNKFTAVRLALKEL